jgi:tetratricopeptide (TPR) repeat protein
MRRSGAASPAAVPSVSPSGGGSGRTAPRWIGVVGLGVAAIAWLVSQGGLSRQNDPRRLALERAARRDPSAAEALERVLEADPDDIEVVRSLAGLGLVTDDPDAALHWLDRWRSIAPGDAVPQRLRLEVAARSGRFDVSIDAGRALLLSESDPLPVLERLVPAEFATGRFEDATAHARELVRRGGSRDADVVLLARCLRAVDRDDEALRLIDPLCRRGPPHTGAAAVRAAILRETDGHQDGDQDVVTMLRAAIDASDDPLATQAARLELFHALDRGDRRDESRDVLAEWERVEAARSILIDASHRPDDPSLREELTRRLAAIGQLDRARAALADLADLAASPRTPTPPARRPPAGPVRGFLPAATTSDGPCLFEDVAPQAGIDFVHDGDATAGHLIQETIGSGVAWIDYDRDDAPDLFCVQVTTPRSARPGHRLYRNCGDGRFRDVTDEARVGLSDYGMGVEVGDVDNDGYDDLVISSLGGIRLLHNSAGENGRRRFLDVTASSGLVDPHWATGLALLDADGDGLLDLYVANYVETDASRPPACRDPRTGLPQACAPTAYEHRHHRFFRNLGGLRFADATAAWGLDALPPAPGLGVVATDLDDDGRCDLYVANDMRPSQLLRNTGSGFEETALPSGCSHGPEGRLMAGMGVVAADLDGSGRASLFVTNFHFEPNVLYRGIGGGVFVESSHRSGLGGPSLSRLGFGAVALDADLDGRLDLAVANGHVNRHAVAISAAPFAQPMQLFLGEGSGRFQDVSDSSGPALAEPRVGRGLAACDFDCDGLPDMAVTANGGRLALFRNRTAAGHAWIRLHLEGDGRSSNRSAIGAKVMVETPHGGQMRFVCGGGSYLSAGDRRLTFGLGEYEQAVVVTVFWPSGRRQSYKPLAPRNAWRLVEGAAAERVPR